MLSMGECAAPIRGMLRKQSNVRVAMAEVTEVDAERRELTLDRGEKVGYDSLIVACGADTSYFGHDEWQEPSFALKTLGGRGRAARSGPVGLRGGRAGDGRRRRASAS